MINDPRTVTDSMPHPATLFLPRKHNRRARSPQNAHARTHARTYVRTRTRVPQASLVASTPSLFGPAAAGPGMPRGTALRKCPSLSRPFLPIGRCFIYWVQLYFARPILCPYSLQMAQVLSYSCACCSLSSFRPQLPLFQRLAASGKLQRLAASGKFVF